MRKHAFFLCLFILVLSNSSFSITIDTLKVGISNSAPFIIENDGENYTGLSVFLWEGIAHKLNLPFKYVKVEANEIVDAIESNKIDLSISPTTVTAARLEKIKFSQPFYISHSIAVANNKESSSSIIATVKRIFSYRFMQVIALLFFILLIFGLLIWLAERKVNNEEFEPNLKGVWSGIWWSAVTMTTVGYGDKSPKSFFGRIIGLIWMFAAIIIISGFTGAIASSLTLDKLDIGITKFSDLRKVSTGTVISTASANHLNRQFIKPRLYNTLNDGLSGLVNDDIEVFIYDEPILTHQLRSNFAEHNLSVLPFKFHRQYYAFGFGKNSSLDSLINPQLLITLRNPTWAALLNEYNLNGEL